MVGTSLPDHLADMVGWVEIEGLGWLREIKRTNAAGAPRGIDFLWWHHCPKLADKPDKDSLRLLDCTSGERHEVTGGSLADGDLTIRGGSGSIPCTDGCGIHGWVRNGRWVPA